MEKAKLALIILLCITWITCCISGPILWIINGQTLIGVTVLVIGILLGGIFAFLVEAWGK